MEDLNQFIDEQLSLHRPHGRYDSSDRTWREPIYKRVGYLIPEEQTRRIAAQQIVDQREATATRLANKLLREIGRTEQWPLDWFGAETHPISIGDQRVRLSDASAQDLRDWAVDERRDAAQEFASRSFACDGAEWAASEMTAKGWTTLAEAMRP